MRDADGSGSARFTEDRKAQRHDDLATRRTADSPNGRTENERRQRTRLRLAGGNAALPQKEKSRKTPQAGHTLRRGTQTRPGFAAAFHGKTASARSRGHDSAPAATTATASTTPIAAKRHFHQAKARLRADAEAGASLLRVPHGVSGRAESAITPAAYPA